MMQVVDPVRIDETEKVPLALPVVGNTPFSVVLGLPVPLEESEVVNPNRASWMPGGA